MSEQQRQNPNMRVVIDGEERIATPENTALYIHTNRIFSALDHIFVMNRDDAENAYGHYVFREQMDNFDTIAQHMQNTGYTVHENEEIADCDRNAYERRFGPPELELPTQELTPRQERFVDYFRYLLANGHMHVDKFEGEGALYI